jgi:transposase-like protein
METTAATIVPPHCPNPSCLYHNQLPTRWRYKKSGFYHRRLSPHRIQRFTCLACGRTFSSQTFSTTYWQKRPDLDRRLFTKLTGCMSLRQIARDLEVSPETVSRHVGRLGRHCLLFHARMMRHARPARAIVIDGFVSFEWSQYFPFHHHLAVEKGTDFLLYTTDSEVRRSGTMTRQQRRRRRELEQRHGRPAGQAVRQDVGDLMSVVIGRQRGVTVYSDDHRAYPGALADVGCQVEHRVTSSRRRRDRHNPLWEVNLADLLLRHSSANHKRETIAWSKRRQGSVWRLGVFLVWRNYMKGRREKELGSATPAMVRGMCERALKAEDILQARLFPGLVALPGRWEVYYWGRVRTRALAVNREHGLTYAA